ncbi:MAG: iron ABC transporter substrate-binding protein [Bacteroidetes bacterium]|nr:iron ABC transporter substrate-binding protein [Bacteroidota bacterium]
MFLVLPFAACTSDSGGSGGDGDPLVIYSGRKSVLVDPLVEQFTEATGIAVEVRSGSDAELVAALQEEGDASPADLYWANTAGALGVAGEAGLFSQLPDSILSKPDGYVPSSGLWVPVTVRFRVMAYDPGRVTPEFLPASVMDLPDNDAFRGQIGWTPTYSSFQDFITAMREIHGEEATRNWIEGMKALEPKAYPSNTPMLEAMMAGEIMVGLTNHYYVLRVVHGGDDDLRDDPTVATHHFGAGDTGNLALVTGAGLLNTSTQTEKALAFLSFLLSEDAQSFAAETVREYPVVRAATVPDYLLPFDEAVALGPEFDFDRLRNLEGTLDLLREKGLL